MSKMILFHPKGDTLKISCIYRYLKWVKNSGSGRRVLEDIEGSSQENWRKSSRLSCLTQKKIFGKFCDDIIIKSVSEIRGKEGGYLEDVESS